MQMKVRRRSNRERREATKAALLRAAREFFVSKGFAETGTPEIVAAAGVTRGALYHHFADKKALFDAVVEEEAASVAEAIEQASPDALSAREALLRGGEAFLDAIRERGRTRLLLLDGPAVLGRARMDEIDAAYGGRTLEEGLAAAMEEKSMPHLPLAAIAAMLSAAFDRAALAIDSGADAQAYREGLVALIDGVVGGSGQER
ncbi:TetR family transcriptional regulator [Alkalilimnicola ehrlichii]|uniref:TetR family transcriptional regulator n=1 Tax=Alkalilimnicola ehrlichii TaxID=351052 RepID=A0A3E0WW12_9GAMM|nr:TetR/AcrR family transcriptional regulator [Alkalilimnicola ehrlichii]RFA29206.1 TetR family transcriptional regulator [Alkalilimnicola ehrlichii]RFA36117.1 TetR family transcriptional regulator [Alkalilimnicola ehrlichii]